MTRYLQLFSRILSGLVSKAKWFFVVSPEEQITRYIYESNKYKTNPRAVHPRAFLPEARNETSVCRITKLENEKIWSIGSKLRGKSVKARADIPVAKIIEIRLKVRPAPLDHVRHAVIVGWPKEKHEHMMFATMIANVATLELP